jgi:hypothetical protein
MKTLFLIELNETKKYFTLSTTINILGHKISEFVLINFLIEFFLNKFRQKSTLKPSFFFYIRFYS